VALARRGERVIALLGDGSSLYSIQGLWSAAQLNLPITFIVVNNGRYEALHSFGRHFGLQELPGTDLPGIDFAALASGQGVRAERVTTADSLNRALSHAFSVPQPTLLEVVVD